MTSLLSGLVFDSANDTINGDTTESVTAQLKSLCTQLFLSVMSHHGIQHYKDLSFRYSAMSIIICKFI